MTAIFLKIVEMSITASWLVLVVLLLRQILKKAPKWIVCGLWILVGVRLICPISIESTLSLMPDIVNNTTEVFQQKAGEEGNIDYLILNMNETIHSITAPATGSVEPHNQKPVNQAQVVLACGFAVWMTGMIVMAIYMIVSIMRIKKQVREAVKIRDRIWKCDTIETPFVLGVLKPRIYLPSNLEPMDLEYVLAHEEAHLKRHDHIWKPLGFALLTVYWFNPILWVAYVLLCRDIEIACDEKVLQSIGVDRKKSYSTALINCSVSRKMIAACPVAFGEIGVKERVKRVLNYSEPTGIMILIAVVLLIGTMVCFLTNPVSATRDMDLSLQEYLEEQILKQHGTELVNDNIGITEFDILAVEETGQEIIVYLWTLYEEYCFEYNELKLEAGVSRPEVLTVKKEKENYELSEYWYPGDGADYGKDIRKKFPMRLWNKVFSHDGVEKLSENVEAKAREYFGLENMPIDPLSDWGLMMELEFLSDTEFEVIFTHSSKFIDVEGTITTSPKYEIWAVQEDTTVPYGEYMRSLGYDYTEPDIGWDDVCYNIPSNERIRLEGSLRGIYDKLPAGEYRFCKPVTLTLDSGESYTKYYTAILYVDVEGLTKLETISEGYH